ncbi:hypothetical protein ACFOLC_16105, partial [Lysobacter cavernae]
SKPNLLRSGKNMAEKACHVFTSTTQVGLTQALGRTGKFAFRRCVRASHWCAPDRPAPHLAMRARQEFGGGWRRLVVFA